MKTKLKTLEKRAVWLGLIVCLTVFAQCATQKGEVKLKSTYRVGLIQLTEDPALNEARRGIVEVFEEEGKAKGTTINVEWASAGGQRLRILSLLNDFQSRNVDLLVTLSSPCLEEAIRNIERLPVVFGATVNPRILGLNPSQEKRLPHFTGIYAEPPWEELGRILERIAPDVRTVGVIWNPSEVNSRYEILMDKTESLLELKPDLIVVMADNTVVKGFHEIASMISEKGVPVITDINTLVKQGAVLGVGFDFHAWGKATGKIAIKVLEGTPPIEIPIEEIRDSKISVNLKAAQRLNLTIPQDIVEKAVHVIR